jgi:uncharacterized membrane protein
MEVGMSGFALLVIAALVWLGLHIGIAGTSAREALVARAGEARFRAGFSIASLAALGLLIAAYRIAPTVPLWTAPGWLRWILALLMLPAFLLLVGAIATPNPTAVGGERAAAQEPRGLLRITRHPMLWSFAIWGFVHVVGAGELASLVFFGTFLVTALAGMPSIDAKLARRDPAAWQRLAAATSIVPGAAILQGRDRLVLGEIGWVVPVIGVAAWLGLLFLHPIMFGASPLPVQ